MLRYIERLGLVEPARTAAGYRLYGAPELQRLRTLRELLVSFAVDLGDVGFALRLAREPELAGAVSAWLDAQPARPGHVPASDWLGYEQDKHERLLAAAGKAGPKPAQGRLHGDQDNPGAARRQAQAITKEAA
jgi:DNA-binding transcriptional MerR regulator